MLLTMILEPNTKSLAFYSFLQMHPLMMGNFSYRNKLNFCLTFLIMFILLMYSLVFYLIIFSFAKRSYSKMLLNFTKFKSSSFFLESFTRIMRDFVNGFLHAFFIFNYKRQIVGIMVSQIIYIIFCIYFRRNYINVFVFMFSTLYYILFFVFNIILVV